MRFLANENVPGPLVKALAEAACDIVWIRTLAPGATDRDVLMRAAAESRVLITFDKDFGELARSSDLPAACGVVLFRLPMPPFPETARLADVVMSRTDWAGRFSIVQPGRVRSRPLKAASEEVGPERPAGDGRNPLRDRDRLHSAGPESESL